MSRAAVEAMIVAAVAAERQACVEALRDKIAEVEAFEARRRIPADEARQLVRRLDAVADAIGQGMHR